VEETGLDNLRIIGEGVFTSQKLQQKNFAHSYLNLDNFWTVIIYVFLKT
jgi:hypothetical protein